MADAALGTATDLAAALRRRTLGCRELLDHYLARVERLNPALNAVVTLDVERARRRADAADEALARGESWGPLHGLPLTIKDSYETAGLRTTCGFEPLRDHVPEADAAAVERLVDAGAVVFGKTNVPTLASDMQSYNPIFGTTNNPWDVGRTPGGSSGGAAAAVATGLTAFELGSDIGGSIRTPSNWCGVYGHKTTYGIVPGRGHIPFQPGALADADLGVFGPIARGADDLELALGVLAGPLPDAAVAWTLALPPPRRTRLQDYRMVAWLDDPAYPVDREVRAVLEEAIAALRRAGVAVDERRRPAVDFRAMMHTYTQLLYPIIMADLPDTTFQNLVAAAEGLPPGDRSPSAVSVRHPILRHRDWLRAHEERTRLRARFAEFFRDTDVLLLPVDQVAAPPHDHSEPFIDRTITLNGAPHPYIHLLSWIAFATVAYLPATAAPVGRTAGGLPVGLQIVGPYLEDRTTIDVARRLADVVGGYAPPPMAR